MIDSCLSYFIDEDLVEEGASFQYRISRESIRQREFALIVHIRARAAAVDLHVNQV